MAKRAATKAKRLAAYVRVSTGEQADSGLGISAQREAITVFAKLRGFEIGGEFCDAGESAAKSPSKRPAMAEALERVRDGEFDGIVALKLDRLSRSCRDVGELVEDCTRRGWALLSVSENIDTTTPSGRMQVQILASFAEFEREMIRERTKAGLAQVAKQGRVRSNKAPFGWRLVAGTHDPANPPRDLSTGEPLNVVADDRVRVVAKVRGEKAKLEHNPAERRILRRMLKLRDEGNGARRIANELNAKKRDHNPRTGEPWKFANVQAILKTYDRRAQLGVA